MIRFSTIFVLAALLVPIPAHAKSPSPDVRSDRMAREIFTDLERRAIDHWIGGVRTEERGDMREERGGKNGKSHAKNKGKGKSKGLPPGLAKRQNLPPGLARQIQRNGTLPPGLQGTALPPDLARRLPPPPTGTRRLIVGDDIVLVNEGTRVILDVLKGVLNGL